jgi:hypothetical protein
VSKSAVVQWGKIGVAAVTFILVLKFVAKKANVPALTTVAGNV